MTADDHGREPELHSLRVQVCQACIRREGSECHTPGCLFWLHSVDDIPPMLADNGLAHGGDQEGQR